MPLASHMVETGVSLGFKTDTTVNNTQVETNALSVLVHGSAKGLGLSAGVAELKVSSTSASGVAYGSVSAEALTAKAHVGLDPNLSGNGLNVYSAGASAHNAKTTLSGGIRLGPLQIGGNVSVGAGAAMSAHIGAGKNGFKIGFEAGPMKTIGLGFSVSWRR